jgi:hypothetical protein
MKKGLIITIQLLTILIMLIPAMLTPTTASATANPHPLYSRTITINSGQVVGTQTDFPLLVSINNDGRLAAHVAHSDGSDIAFTDSTGATRYYYEIESYDSVNGTLVAWVNVSSIT